MTKINLKKIFFLLTFFSFYLTYSQTYIDEIVNSVEFVNKNKLLNVLLDPTSKGLSSPFLPIYVENNQKIEKVIVSNIDFTIVR